jgi:transposase
VRAYEGEGSQRQLARVFGVSLGFIQGLLQHYRRTGGMEPKGHGGGNPGKITWYFAAVAPLHSEQPAAALAEQCERLARERGGAREPGDQESGAAAGRAHP